MTFRNSELIDRESQVPGQPCGRHSVRYAWGGLIIVLGVLGSPVRAAPREAEVPVPTWPPTVERNAQLSVTPVTTHAIQGLAWQPKDQQLYLTVSGDDLANSQVLRVGNEGAPELWLDQAQGLSGIIFSRRGQLLGAQTLGHCIVNYSVGKRGPRRREVLLEEPSLHQPNDLCEAPNGDIYFTDPDFLRHTRSGVYLLQSKGELLQLITEMPLPNGLALSLDSTALYVSDSQDKNWRRYPLMGNGVTAPGALFFDPPTSDRTPPNGLTIDAEGHLYLTGRGGVWVVNSEGESLGLIKIPGFCSAVAFGGPDGKTLFMASDQNLYRLRMRVPGGRWQRSHPVSTPAKTQAP